MEHFDLIIIGTGSGNSIIGPDFDDWNVAIIEKGVFGGTCLNVGCIPSKMFVYAAELAEHAKHGAKLGIDTQFNGADWPAIRDRVFGRIDPIAAGGERYRAEECANVTVFKEHARFTGPKQVQAGDTTLTAEHIVLAAGARTFTPPIAGLDQVEYHTSDSIMRLDALPERLLVFGGGYIASEMAHVFGGLGSQVTMVNRGGRLLRNEDADISDRFTEVYGERFDLVLGTADHRVSQDAGGTITMELTHDGAARTIEADALLVATGRVPNGDQMDLDVAGIAVDDRGYVVTDGAMRTNVDGVWALGDITNPVQLKHTANAEAKIVAHNIAHPDDPIEVDLSFTPHAVFGYPQVAAVGLTEEQARAAGHNVVVKIQNYGDTAYGWAMEDETSICKLIADADSRALLGAHILGPQASTLLQQLVQGMRFGQTVDEMARGQIWTHPALPEVVENALLGL